MEHSSIETPELEESGGGGGFIKNLPVILWQRKWWIIVPAVIGIIGGVAAALLIPPVYRSNAVMLVQSPQLPDEVIGIAMTDLVDRRMALIRQQITARPDLIDLIQRHGLYASERQSGSLSSVVQEMRDAISLTPTQASLPNNRSEDRTIAVELAFEYSEPVATQAVAQDLMSRVLQLDARGNVEQATSTVQFLTDQAAGLEQQIANLQSQISQVNTANGAVLAGGGLMIGGNAGTYDVQIAALMRDNQALQQQRRLAQSSDTRSPVVVEAEQRLTAARAIYAESHPDVVIAKQNLEQARELAKSNVDRLPLEAIDQQIAFNNSQIAALRSAKANEVAQTNSRLAAQARAPLVQQQLSELQTQLTTLNGQYEVIQNRLLAARAGVQAEDQQMGERLSVIETPIVPDEPSWPNRPLVALLGAVTGLGLGFVLAFAVEIFLRPIRDPGALREALGHGPFGVIPVIEPKKSFRRRSRFSFSR